MECIFASVLCIAGVFTGIGKFKDVDLKTEINSRFVSIQAGAHEYY